MNETEPTSSKRMPPERNGRRRSRAWRWIVPVVVLFLVLIYLLRPVPLAVEIARVDRGPLTVSVLEEGKTRIRNRYVISSPLNGILSRPTLREGDALVAGETVVALLETQPSGFLNARSRTQAEAVVEAAGALVRLRGEEIESARAAFDFAVKERARAEALRMEQTISAADLDRAETEATIRERDLRAAEFALEMARFDLAQAKAALLKAGGGGEVGDFFEIRSPVDGVVLNVFEESERFVAAGTPLVEVGDPGDLEIEVELLSQDAVGVSPGAEVRIERWGGDEPLGARVTVVEPAAFTKISALGVEEQRVIVRAEFVDPLPAGVRLGDRFRVEARVVTWRAGDVLRIPTGALFRRGGGWVTFLFDDGQARVQVVRIGHNNGVFAEIAGGIGEGQTVIVHPPDVVADGTTVRAREDGSD